MSLTIYDVVLQVCRCLWCQQALAQHKQQNPNSTTNRQNPNTTPPRPPFVAVSAITSCHRSSNKYFAQQTNQLQLQNQWQQKQGVSDKPVAVSAAVLTKRLSNLSAVLAEKVDVDGTIIGWEGSDLVIRLLKELYRKLLCKLALQVSLS